MPAILLWIAENLLGSVIGGWLKRKLGGGSTVEERVEKANEVENRIDAAPDSRVDELRDKWTRK